MAETQYSVRSVKHFKYRGNPIQQWSNRYHFDGSAPADTAAWVALFDALVALERPCNDAGTHWDACYGYAPGSQVAVASKAYAVAGTLSSTGTIGTPGDCAIVLRQATTKRSIKNHPVYCFSYFHDALMSSSSSDNDTPLPAQVTAIDALGAAWLAGIVGGSRTYKRTTPDGHLVTGHAVSTWISHRDFPH